MSNSPYSIEKVVETTHPAASDWQWDLPDSPATIDQIVCALDPLLEAVLLQLGDMADRTALVGQLEATLGFSAREACLPLAHIAADDGLRHDLAEQALRIGNHIIETVYRVSESRISRFRYGETALKTLNPRSHCDGHVWCRDVAKLLTGAAGGPGVMQLYNEWLHQIVLLRDSLIPFANWQTLPVPLHRLGGAPGLRALEEPRQRFVGDLLSKRIEHVSIVRMARALFGLPAEAGGYGFVIDGIMVLPAAVNENISTAAKGLLIWAETTIDGIDSASPVLLRPEIDDYFAAARSPVGLGNPKPKKPRSPTTRLVGHEIAPGQATVAIAVTIGSSTFHVDLGQALRGHRFSYRPDIEPHVIGPAENSEAIAVWHDPADILALSALVTAPDGIHVVALTDVPLADLALLGKIYPENTVLRGAADWDLVVRAGKQYGARFVLQSFDRPAHR